LHVRTSPNMIHRGLTLIEVLIVIAILLAIGGLVVVNLLPAKDQADIDLQKAQFDMVKTAMDKFKLDMKRYPSDEEGLAALNSKDAIADEADQANWRGPYVENSIVKDNWNHDIVYRFPGELRGEQYYDLISFGPDGEEGTADDITNHDRMKGADGEIATEGDSFAPPAGGGGTDSGGTGG
jgi:general secretion pathway protein G